MFRELLRKSKKLPLEECIGLLERETRGVLSVIGDEPPLLFECGGKARCAFKVFSQVRCAPHERGGFMELRMRERNI